MYFQKSSELINIENSTVYSQARKNQFSIQL